MLVPRALDPTLEKRNQPVRTIPALTIGIGLATSALGACTISIDGCEPTVHGSGTAATETRAVPDFDSIQVDGGARIVARVGEPQSLSVTCDDNLLRYVETEVRGGELRIGMKPGNYAFEHGIEIALSVPALRELSIRGSCAADITGFSGGSFDVTVTGSGDVRAAGQLDQLSAEVTGSGDLDFFGVAAREARVGISGSGDIAVQAIERLEARISGSGDVRYRGNPATNVHISGSGSVSKG